jgi:hypothetical protein
MESGIARAIGLEDQPVAMLVAGEEPEGALRLLPGRQSCAMFQFAAAAGGRTAAFDRRTYGCPGGGVGLCFGDRYLDFPGGHEGFSRFLSDGNAGTPQGEAIGEAMRANGAPETFVAHFLHGERYKKTPELVHDFVRELPMEDVGERFVVFKPLSAVDPAREEPVSVTLLVDPDRLSALVYLANYDRPGLENVAIPFAAACQTIGLLGLRESRSASPRCLVGMVDLSARNYLKERVRGRLSFTIPYRRFLEMEANVPGSFLEGDTWRSLAGGRVG